MTYKPITYGEAKEKGTPGKATINGKEYSGFIYEGYFFHHINRIGKCKILLKYCKEVEQL